MTDQRGKVGIPIHVFQHALESVCVTFNGRYSKAWGFRIAVDSARIDRAWCFFDDILTENPALPDTPGPFKIGAAFLVSAMHFVEFDFTPLGEGDAEIDKAGRKVWKSRLLLKAIPVVLNQLILRSTGTKLAKNWDVPSLHYRLDFLNFVRWCEFPIDGPVDPPPPSKPTVDVVRANRLILALTLIIEACYYNSENNLTCDVRGKARIDFRKVNEELFTDLFFDSPILSKIRDMRQVETP